MSDHIFGKKNTITHAKNNAPLCANVPFWRYTLSKANPVNHHTPKGTKNTWNVELTGNDYLQLNSPDMFQFRDYRNPGAVRSSDRPTRYHRRGLLRKGSRDEARNILRSYGKPFLEMFPPNTNVDAKKDKTYNPIARA